MKSFMPALEAITLSSAKALAVMVAPLCRLCRAMTWVPDVPASRWPRIRRRPEDAVTVSRSVKFHREFQFLDIDQFSKFPR